AAFRFGGAFPGFFPFADESNLMSNVLADLVLQPSEGLNLNVALVLALKHVRIATRGRLLQASHYGFFFFARFVLPRRPGCQSAPTSLGNSGSLFLLAVLLRTSHMRIRAAELPQLSSCVF